MKKIIMVAIFLVITVALIFLLNQKINQPMPGVNMIKEPVVIGFSLGATMEDRWNIDRDLFVKKAEELGAIVRITASSNAQEQSSEIRNFISQGVKVIVVVPSNSEEISLAIQEANNAGVKVIAYDRLIKNSTIDFYISFDNVEVGRLEAESVLNVKGSGKFAYIGGAPTDNNAFLLKEGSMLALQKKIDSGEIDLVIDKFTDDWKQEEAYKTIKAYLTGGGKIDAIIAANDGTATGAIQALKEGGLDGKVPVSGQDAELSACQRIIAGTQTATVYKPISQLASQAAVAAVEMAQGLTPETNATINNGKIEVPSYFLNPIIVDKNNMIDTIIKDGFHSYKDVYLK